MKMIAGYFAYEKSERGPVPAKFGIERVGMSAWADKTIVSWPLDEEQFAKTLDELKVLFPLNEGSASR